MGSRTGRSSRAGGAGVLLVVVSAVVFVDTIFYTAITPLLPHYVHALHLSKTEAGLLVAAYPAGTLLGSIPSGALASRIGLRPAVITGLALMSVATLVFGFGHSAELLDLARFVQGVGSSCTWAGGLAWLAVTASPDRRGSALGVAFGSAVGGALLGPVVGAIASRVGTGPTFAAASVLAAVLIVASFSASSPAPGERQPLRDALRAVRDPSVGGGMWLTALAGMGFGVVDVLAPLRLNALGGSATVIGAVFLLAAAVEGVLSPVVGRISDRLGRSAPVRVSLAGAVVVSLLAPFVAPKVALGVVLVLGLPAFGTLFVPAAAMMSDGAARQGLHQGMGFALSNLAWAGGQAVAAAGAGAVAQATFDAVPYGLIAVVCFATLVVMLRLRSSPLVGNRVPAPTASPAVRDDPCPQP